jgi:hypothetical protein
MNVDKRNAYMILVAKPEGKRLVGRPRRKWEDNIKINFCEIAWCGGDWINLAQGPMESSYEHGNEFRVP